VFNRIKRLLKLHKWKFHCIIPRSFLPDSKNYEIVYKCEICGTTYSEWTSVVNSFGGVPVLIHEILCNLVKDQIKQELLPLSTTGEVTNLIAAILLCEFSWPCLQKIRLDEYELDLESYEY
jgi:hypothetical protein